MRERLKVGALCIAHVQMIDARHLQVHSAGGRDLQPIQPVQLVHRPIAERAEQLTVDGKPEFVQPKRDGQLELFVDEERKDAVALLDAESANNRCECVSKMSSKSHTPFSLQLVVHRIAHHRVLRIKARIEMQRLFPRRAFREAHQKHAACIAVRYGRDHHHMTCSSK